MICSSSQMFALSRVICSRDDLPVHTPGKLAERKRGSFLPFAMETALYPRHYKCSAASSLPPAPGSSSPTGHPPLTSLPSSPSSPQQVTANFSGRGARAKPDS